MKTFAGFSPLFFMLFFSLVALAQTPPKPKPGNAEVEEARRQAEEMMKQLEGQLTPEQKRMMESMGIKLSSSDALNSVGLGGGDVEMGVPNQDEARIAAIPTKVSRENMGAYLSDLAEGLSRTLAPETLAEAAAIFQMMQAKSSEAGERGAMAMGFWMTGEPELALTLMGHVLQDDPTNPDHLNNFAAMLSMQGAQHLAIPILNLLDAQFPNNSTLLNNLGQAWLGLGDLPKAEKYLDGALALYAYHPQANQSKCYIEHSKGNDEKAVEHLEKSMEHSYTAEKAVQLSQFGKKVNFKSFRLPKRGNGDGLNLGGFRPPAFPKTVNECITLGRQWTEFIAEIDMEIEQLEARKADLEENTNQTHLDRMDQDIQMIKVGRSDPPSYAGQSFSTVPMYSDRANKVFAYVSEEHARRIQDFTQRMVGKVSGELLEQHSQYQAQMDKLRKEEDEQLGAGRANESFCPKYKQASDDYLRAANPALEELYYEYLDLQKAFLNEMAYWSLYTVWSEQYELVKVSLQIQWLQSLKDGFGHVAYNTNYPFNFITGFDCDPPQDDGRQVKLANFDDIHCEYTSHIDYELVVIDTNCSTTTTTYNLGETTVIERELGGEFIGSTVKTSSEISVGGQVGPLKVEGSIGTDVTVEKDENGKVKEWKSTVTGALESGVGVSKGPVRAGGTLTNAIEVEIGSKGLEDINMITKLEGKAGIGAASISAGVSDRVSLISGHGSVTGTGILSGMIFSQW